MATTPSPQSKKNLQVFNRLSVRACQSVVPELSASFNVEGKMSVLSISTTSSEPIILKYYEHLAIKMILANRQKHDIDFRDHFLLLTSLRKKFPQICAKVKGGVFINPFLFHSQLLGGCITVV